MTFILLAFLRRKIQNSEKIKVRLDQLKIPNSVFGFKLF